MMEIWEKHPEVYHYTSAQGLQGILSSQTLFATHYDYLNDGSELRLLREALPGGLEQTVKEHVLKRWRESSAEKKQIRKLGGVLKVSRDIAADFATIHFDAAFAEIGGNPATTG